MNWLKSWLLDVGLWEAESIEDWSWRRFRPKFWNTYTNLTHRTYRQAISELVAGIGASIRESYIQGARDAALQLREHQELGSFEAPKEWYPN